MSHINNSYINRDSYCIFYDFLIFNFTHTHLSNKGLLGSPKYIIPCKLVIDENSRK